MEFTKEQYKVLEEASIELGISIEKLIRNLEELAFRFKIAQMEAELLERAIENIKQMEYEHYESIMLQERGPLPPYRPKTKPGIVYKRKIYWKRIRSNPRQR